MHAEADTVAVIDADPIMRQTLGTLLLSSGYQVELYTSSEAFLSHAAHCRAMCLLIDVKLGPDSGIELARQLAEAGFELPIIFMTDNDDKEIRREANEVGCVGLLQKPLAAKLLMSILAHSKNGRSQ
jgi:FixJ family two-component response regulator